ncbi:MAG: hypothetical protein JRC68_08530 [Deltaproteobacteria bacterium]|nr:hypothetical protein [Deltaproteobacteria bacterium]
MDVIEKVLKTEFLGRDFLVWLWFKSDTNDGIIDLGDDNTVELWFDGKVTLQSESDEAVETVTCSGINPRLREARFALTENKKVTKASIRLHIGDDEYGFTLDSSWLNFGSFKAPKVMQDDNDDPDGLFYEKAGLIEKAVATMDTIFSIFIKIRVSQEWKSRELPALAKWINRQIK